MNTADIRLNPVGWAEVHRTIFQLTQAINLGVEGVTAGQAIAGGSGVMAGNPTAVTTGLASVTAFVAFLNRSTTPTSDTAWLSATVSGGTASVYAWQDDGTASGGVEPFWWIALGTV